MLEPTYRQALSRAWTLVWHHKILWVLGLLSVFVGELGLSNFLGQMWAKLVSPTDSWWPSSWGTFHITTGVELFWFLWLLIIIGSLVLFVIVAAVCAEAALIYAVQHWYRFHKSPALSVAWHKATPHFWGVFAVNVLEKFLLGAILAVLVAVVPLIPDSVGGFYPMVVLIALAVFVALLVVLTATFALGYVVHDSIPVVEALGAGWHLLKKHLLVSLELTAILILCNVLIAWVISIGSIAALVPSFVVALVGGASGLNALVGFAVGLYLVFFVIFIVALGAFFNTFTTAAWMYLFMKMHHEGLTSRLAYWAMRLVGKK